VAREAYIGRRVIIALPAAQSACLVGFFDLDTMIQYATTEIGVWGCVCSYSNGQSAPLWPESAYRHSTPDSKRNIDGGPRGMRDDGGGHAIFLALYPVNRGTRLRIF